MATAAALTQHFICLYTRYTYVLRFSIKIKLQSIVIPMGKDYDQWLNLLKAEEKIFSY